MTKLTLVPLVEILKHHYPKLVELHNYCPKNSYSQKLINWETLNNKVLKKLQINLTKKRIDQLCKAEMGAIERLLLEIKQKVEQKTSGNEHCEVFYLEGPNNGKWFQNTINTNTSRDFQLWGNYKTVPTKKWYPAPWLIKCKPS